MKHRIRWENKNFGDIGTLKRYDSEILILNRKEFVAMLLWRNLNYKFLNILGYR